jgi:hypothetical protein
MILSRGVDNFLGVEVINNSTVDKFIKIKVINTIMFIT